MDKITLTASTIGATTGAISLIGTLNTIETVIFGVATIICASTTICSFAIRIYKKAKEYLNGKKNDKEFVEEIEDMTEDFKQDMGIGGDKK